MTQYYSNWNRNRRPGLKNILNQILVLPKRLWEKIRNEKSLRRKIFLVVMYLAASFLLLGSITFAVVSLSLPDPNKLNDRIVAQSTKIYARDAKTLLYEVQYDDRRNCINFNENLCYAKQAITAIEDKNFYKNSDVYWRGIRRSVTIY